MANNPLDNHDNEEEYNFVETENSGKADQYAPAVERKSAQSATGSASGSSVFDDGRRKKIFIIIGGLIALFCLYKLYGLFSTTPKNAASLSAMNTTMNTTSGGSAATKSAAAPKMPTVPAESITREVSAVDKDITKDLKKDINKDIGSLVPSSDTKVVNDKLNELSQAVDAQGKTTENLQQQITGLTGAITDIQNNIAMLTQQLGTLANGNKASEKSEKSEKSAKTEKSAAEKAVQKTATGARKSSGHAGRKSVHATGTYYIRALIQGRAWLMAPDGNTFTISAGDMLPGYGEVQKIDTDNGTIMTSSGRVIVFRPEDR